MGESPWNPPHQDIGKIDKAPGGAAPVHQLPGQNKKGHGHQRKRIDPGEHPLGNEQQRHITYQQDHQGGDSQAECHGKPSTMVPRNTSMSVQITMDVS